MRIMETRVVNRRYSGDDVLYVGRPSRWGNPFPARTEADRDQVCDLHEMHLALQYLEGEVTDADFDSLRGKALQCFCAPKRCHADTLKKVADMEPEQRRQWARAIADAA
jgi:hypothetical protein